MEVTAPTRSRAMSAVVWTCQILLALVFLAHGAMLLVPPAEIAAQMNAVLPRGFWLFLGIAEVAAGIGLVVPAWTRRYPWLTWWAAGGIMFVMISATIFHLMRREISSAIVTFVLLCMATFVASARRHDYPMD
jgi:putative oxidoreductase